MAPLNPAMEYGRVEFKNLLGGIIPFWDKDKRKK
jgi:hypothetical protein